MCNTCLTFEHSDGDYIFRTVFGHHQNCPNLRLEEIRTADLANRLDNYITGRANRLAASKISAEKAHQTRRRNNAKPAKDRPVREHDIQDVLYKNLRWQKKHKWIAPNVELFSTGEMDLCSVAPSGLIHEYEIKLSRADFLADRKKEEKHQMLVNACAGVFTFETPFFGRTRTVTCTVPNYFSYVVPRDMVGPDEVPAYAGLVYVDLDKLWNYGLALEFVKRPQLLHKNKVEDRVLLDIGEKLMYRCWAAREKLTRQHAISQETAL
jgi:hypothetical protein